MFVAIHSLEIFQATCRDTKQISYSVRSFGVGKTVYVLISIYHAFKQKKKQKQKPYGISLKIKEKISKSQHNYILCVCILKLQCSIHLHFAANTTQLNSFSKYSIRTIHTTDSAFMERHSLMN